MPDPKVTKSVEDQIREFSRKQVEATYKKLAELGLPKSMAVLLFAGWAATEAREQGASLLGSLDLFRKAWTVSGDVQKAKTN